MLEQAVDSKQVVERSRPEEVVHTVRSSKCPSEDRSTYDAGRPTRNHSSSSAHHAIHHRSTDGTQVRHGPLLTSSWTMKYGYSTATLSLSVPRYQSGGYKI